MPNTGILHLNLLIGGWPLAMADGRFLIECITEAVHMTSAFATREKNSDKQVNSYELDAFRAKESIIL